jgi:hypothetical protein
MNMRDVKFDKNMNIFEDLIEELKEENLLEETVIDVHKNKSAGQKTNFQDERFDSPEILKAAQFDGRAAETAADFPPPIPAPDKMPEALLASNGDAVSQTPDPFDPVPEAASPDDELQPEFSDAPAGDSEQPLNQVEFYKKRATDEVNSLQMVEHVLSGVERDYLNRIPKLYDDLEVKKALHNFLQFAQNVNSPEHAQAEFLLMQETESWYSALSQKDKDIGVGQLRRYCETTRPVLSSQALAALARFYRNAPFSESVRGKFDLVITRYFARETGGDIRKLIGSRDDIIEKLNQFYAEWSSIPLYDAEEDESNIILAAIRLEEFMTEAEEAESIEDLFKSDFFNRLKSFKESTHENFFAPLVTATAVESNVRIGNRYLQLLLSEKEKQSAAALEEKYGAFHEEVISEVLCKTIQITSVFEGKFADPDVQAEAVAEMPQGGLLEFEKQNLYAQAASAGPAKAKESSRGSLFRINKWLLAAVLVVLVSSLGLYVWVEYLNPAPKLSDNVKTVNLDNSSLRDYVQTARLNGDMFYGVVTPAWDSLNDEKKEELLRKIIMIGGEKGFVKVTLMNKQGRSVGYASPEKVEVYNP